ncbi:hypothetical protein IWW38_005306, partial [Coemansia aciculifera]
MVGQEPDTGQQTAGPGAAEKLRDILPGISILTAEHESLGRSTSQDSIASNVLSYMHTPAELYEEHTNVLYSQATTAATAANSRIEETSCLDAAVDSLQSIVSGAVMVPGTVWYLVSQQ